MREIFYICQRDGELFRPMPNHRYICKKAADRGLDRLEEKFIAEQLKKSVPRESIPDYRATHEVKKLSELAEQERNAIAGASRRATALRDRALVGKPMQPWGLPAPAARFGR